jgi:hypothetical protein
VRLLSAILITLTASGGLMLAQGAPEGRGRMFGGGLSPEEARSRFAELPEDVRQEIRRRHEALRQMTPEERREQYERFQNRRRMGPVAGGGAGSHFLRAMAARKVARRVFAADPTLSDKLREMERSERREAMRELMQDEIRATFWAIYLTPSELASLTPGATIPAERVEELNQLVKQRREQAVRDAINQLPADDLKTRLSELTEERFAQLLRDFGSLDLDIGADPDPKMLQHRRSRILAQFGRSQDRRGPGPDGERPDGKGFRGERPDNRGERGPGPWGERPDGKGPPRGERPYRRPVESPDE